MHKQEQPEWVRKRAGRLRRGCIPEVLAAVEAGYLSPSWADKLYRKLPAEEQRARIAEIMARRERCRLAVEILKRHIDAGTADLHALQRDLASALSTEQPFPAH
jgi:hypothetical protein